MPSEKQRTKVYFDLREAEIPAATEDVIRRMMSDDTLPFSDACDLVGYVSDLAKMRWAMRTGNYDTIFAPKDLENTMANLQDLIQRYKPQ